MTKKLENLKRELELLNAKSKTLSLEWKAIESKLKAIEEHRERLMIKVDKMNFRNQELLNLIEKEETRIRNIKLSNSNQKSNTADLPDLSNISEDFRLKD